MDVDVLILVHSQIQILFFQFIIHHQEPRKIGKLN